MVLVCSACRLIVGKHFCKFRKKNLEQFSSHGADTMSPDLKKGETR